MIIYPAIDMKDGRCVRLLQGRAEDVTDYGDPCEVARRWAQAGARWIHLVDLDGAFSGQGKNREVIARIAQEQSVPVQLGGGIRTMADVEDRLERVGVSRVILGTAAVENPRLVKEACRAYPGRVAVGIDARDGFVAVRGWTERSDVPALELARRVRDAGVETVVYTDISKDGMMQGPSIEQTARMVRESGLRVIGSGGVSSLADIGALKEAGCAGVITGKALYSGAFTLAQALGYEED
ncbi:1-(5-phosphoribosyl)-5-[(5-phosphoribosylamino)methylideneamino]imidazole-4-carboxamide isomerase [Beduinella massiliensis]|uniref:1-(5-phosphoribosyl)-5-[(5- phosphoribosylamino)methylideneamino]imidazole-4- carboxamide isomerase n=1 Tax=Beduinella massiliensis TaxID=1852363 RepID=UPI000C84BDE7